MRSGILGDALGYGKTACMIALVLHTRDRPDFDLPAPLLGKREDRPAVKSVAGAEGVRDQVEPTPATH